MDDIFVMQVNKSFCDFFEYFSDGFVRNFSNKVAQITIRTVLQNDYEVLLLVEEKELPCFEDVGMFQRDMKLCLFLASSLLSLVTEMSLRA